MVDTTQAMQVHTDADEWQILALSQGAQALLLS